MKYDYVIVGAGSAGCVLAGRLSEDPDVSVLLIEAGNDWEDGVLLERFRYPRLYYKWDIEGEVPFSWHGLEAIRTSAQPREKYMRGKGFGGSSVINGAVILRPPLEEFDDWSATGLTGWGRDDVLPAFTALENDHDYGGQDEYHGADGPFPIVRSDESQWGDMDRIMKAAALEMGHAWERDLHLPGVVGASICPQNIVDDARVTTVDAFLADRDARPNLHLRFDTLVDVLTFDGDRVTGVRVVRDGVAEDIEAGEVILAAGAVHSPLILQRSGIGPAALLEQHGIPVRVDLPVGQHMQDHAGLEIETVARAPMQQPPVGSKRGNVLLRFSSGLAGVGDVAMKALNVGPDGIRSSILVSLEQTFSSGRIEITSADPEAHPLVDFNLLSDERDRERMRYLYRHALAFFETDAWRSRIEGETYCGAPLPSADASDDELDAWLFAGIRDTAHMTSSVRMGPDGDDTAVLDAECRVRGVGNLRVADASSLPTVCRANSHLTVLMLAWRVADFVKAARAAS